MSTKVVQHSYHPYGSAALLFQNRSSEVLMSGPAGTGKSRACLEKVHAMLLANAGARALMVRKTATSLKTTAIVTYRRDVAAEMLLSGDVCWRATDGEFHYSNTSCLVTGGLDKSDRIMSSEYDVIYVQEATELTEDDWEKLTTRLRNNRVSFQQLLADCNPSSQYHFLYQRFTHGRLTMLESKHEENPLLFDPLTHEVTAGGASYIQKLDALTGIRKKRLRYGQWVAAEGVIYEGFGQANLVDLVPVGSRKAGSAESDLDKYKVPNSWPRYWGIDFGFTNPFVCQCWAEDPDGRLYLYREFYHTQRRVEQMAKEILADVTDDDGNWLTPKPDAIICDHDAEGRSVFQQELGIQTRNAHKSVKEGIQAVQERMQVAGDNKPRLFLLRDALARRDQELVKASKPLCTLDEIPGYVWDGTKEKPVKEDDHGCDAMRYVVAFRDLGAKPSIRVFKP